MARPFESRQLAAFRDFSSLVKSPSFVQPLSIYGRVLSIGLVLEGPVIVHTSPTYVTPLTDARAFLRRYPVDSLPVFSPFIFSLPRKTHEREVII